MSQTSTESVVFAAAAQGESHNPITSARRVVNGKAQRVEMIVLARRHVDGRVTASSHAAIDADEVGYQQNGDDRQPHFA